MVRAGIALGNVVGSNIANLLLVLGIPALISTIPGGGAETRRSYLIMLGGTVLFVALACTGRFGVPQALVLLAALGLTLWDNFRMTGRNPPPQDEGIAPLPVWRIAVFIVIGLVGLPIGAGLLVAGASDIARALGVDETVIGLTLVAVGTSLPELSASVTAALRGRSDVAIGNVIGSNLFNLLGIIGVAGLVAPLPVPAAMLRYDLWAMLAATLLLAPVLLSGRAVTRPIGAFLVATYAAFVLSLVV